MGSEMCIRDSAETEQRVHSKKEDLLAGVIRFRNGTICYLNVNWLTPTRIRKLYITGEKGMFVINYLDQNLYFYENEAQVEDDLFGLIKEGRMIKFKINKKEPLKNEIKHFAECINENKEPLVSGEDGKKALAIALKIIESAEKGEVISCENCHDRIPVSLLANKSGYRDRSSSVPTG